MKHSQMKTQSKKTKENTNETKELQTEEQTLDMSEAGMRKRIEQKKDKLASIFASIEIYGMKGLNLAQKSKGKDLEDRLLFRTLQAEEELLDDKIEIYSELLRIIKK